jgi:hypothetical protein
VLQASRVPINCDKLLLDNVIAEAIAFQYVYVAEIKHDMATRMLRTAPFISTYFVRQPTNAMRTGFYAGMNCFLYDSQRNLAKTALSVSTCIPQFGHQFNERSAGSERLYCGWWQ